MWLQISIFITTLSSFGYCQNNHIVNGRDATIEEFPWQVALLYNGNLICGGSIISDRYILTAAHCLDTNNAGGYSVRVGSTYFNQGGTIYYVSELHPHPNDDIGLVKLSRTLSFGRTVKPITLASEEPRAGSPATVSGWGGLSTGGPLSVTLQALDQRIGGRFGCFLAYGFAFHSRRICAVNPIDNAGTCFGDSGGPLVSNKKLVGTVIGGRGECGSDFPNLYSNVAKFLSWIALITQ